MAPIKKFQVKTKYAAWLSDDSKENIKKRDEAQEKAALSGSPEDWAVYKRLRNELTKSLRKEKIAWQQGKLDSCEESKYTGKH